MIWLVMIVGGIFTFGTRFVMLSGWVAHGLPRWLIDALAFVPIAVLTAILVPAVLIDPATQQIIVIGNKRIVAAVVATIIALLTRNVIATISSGLATLWFVQWWL
jgi:branched-subunit amino acid transport protein